MKNQNLAKLAVLGLFAFGAVPVWAAPFISPFHFGHGGYVSGISDNGKWAVGVPKSGEHTSKTQIVDLTTGEVIDLKVDKVLDADGFEIDLDDEFSEGNFFTTTFVTDEGDLLAGSFNGNPGYWKDGIWQLLEFPNENFGDPYLNFTAEVFSVRGGGKYVIGMGTDKGMNIIPLIWIDGKLAQLEGLPTEDYNGHPLEGDSDITTNMRFLDITNDGKKLLGTMGHNFSAQGTAYPCAFIYDMEEKTYEFLGEKEFKSRIAAKEIGPESSIDGAVTPQFSANEKWVAGNVLMLYETGTSEGRETYVPFLYNVETKEFKILEGEENEEYMVSGVTDEGKLMGVYPYNNPTDRKVMFKNGNGQWYSLENILEQGYGIQFTAATGYDMLSGSGFGLSRDGRTMVGMVAPYQDDAYVVTLDDTDFFTASDKVNLLYNYQVIPEAHSTIAVFDKFYIRFDNPCTPVAQNLVELRDGEGKVVATSQSVKNYQGDERIFEIEFPQTDLNDGVRYSVVVPAGAFKIESVGHVNNEITVNYTGRETKPIEMRSSSPRSGTAVTEIGANNVVAITFDGTTQTTPGAVGYLYQEGFNDPITTLVLTASRNQVIAYPAASRKLMDGTHYQVKIPAGAIVDITGYCPNEEIVLEYDGAYTIPLPDPESSYLFYEDFDDMGSSLAHLLRYEGDHNAPTAAMEAFEFDADNQPWNFSVREDATSSDYVAMSHSVYANRGQSDDWMVIPQVNLGTGSEVYTLNFQGQSFYKDKEDYLKIIVWECDDVYSTLDKNITDRMRAEGDVIFNERLYPGESEDLLSGDWVDYQINLDDYKGKNIYVAFINENQNQSAIFVNNLNILKQGNFQAGFSVASTLTNAESVSVDGFVRITRDLTFEKLSAKLYDSKSELVSSYEADNLGLKENDTYKFTFPEELKLEAGAVNNFTMTVTLDGEDQEVASSISNLLFEPQKRVVLEEVTGSWCGNCPQGIKAIEYLEENFPENFIPVSIHNNDAYAYLEYENFLGLHAYPTGRINRLEGSLAPMLSYAEGYSYISKTGEETFTDIFLKEMEVASEAAIEIEKAVYDGYNVVNVETVVTFPLTKDKANYNILTLIVEDGLKGMQTNYFAGNTDPLMEDWGLKGPYAVVDYVDVARGIAGVSFNGENGYIPSEVKAGEDYTADIELTVPSTVSKLENCKVICMLIDPATEKIINAARINKIDGVDSVKEITSDNNFEVTIENGTIFVNGDKENVEVYTLQGQRADNGSLAKGMYIVRSVVDGQVVAAKVAVK
jgi:thiol-disulfide isomerase/thioredoxin